MPASPTKGLPDRPERDQQRGRTQYPSPVVAQQADELLDPLLKHAFGDRNEQSLVDSWRDSRVGAATIAARTTIGRSDLAQPFAPCPRRLQFHLGIAGEQQLGQEARLSRRSLSGQARGSRPRWAGRGTHTRSSDSGRGRTLHLQQQVEIAVARQDLATDRQRQRFADGSRSRQRGVAITQLRARGLQRRAHRQGHRSAGGDQPEQQQSPPDLSLAWTVARRPASERYCAHEPSRA